MTVRSCAAGISPVPTGRDPALPRASRRTPSFLSQGESCECPLRPVCCNERRRNRPEQSAHGLFLPEIAHPFKALDRARVAVEFASPLGGKPPEDGFDADDPAQTTFLDSKADRRLSRSRKLTEVDVLDYDASSSLADLDRWLISLVTQRCRPQSSVPGTQA